MKQTVTYIIRHRDMPIYITNKPTITIQMLVTPQIEIELGSLTVWKKRVSIWIITKQSRKQ